MLSLFRLASFLVFEINIMNKYNYQINLFNLFGNFSSSCFQLLTVSFPLALTGFLGALFTSIPKLIIEDELGLNALAIYSALSSLLIAFTLIANSFVQSSLPDFSRLYKVNINKYLFNILNVLFKLTIFAIFCISICYFYGEDILEFIFGAKYSNYRFELVFVILSGFGLSLFSIGNLLMSSQHNFLIQLPIYIFVCFLIYMISNKTILIYGLSGVIVAQFLGYFFGFLICCIIFTIRFNKDNHALES